MAKMGRPQQTTAKKRAREARAEIRRRYPITADLIDRLAYGNFDKLAAVAATFDRAIEEIAQVFPSGHGLPKSPTLEDKILHTSDQIGGLSQTVRILSNLQDVIDSELVRAATDLGAAKVELLNLAIQREPLDQYACDLIEQLQVAGMTRAKGGRVGSAQVKQIMEIIVESNPRKPARSSQPASELQLPLPPPNNPWLDFPHQLEHYTLVRKDITRDPSLENKNLLLMNLPPFDHLEKFGVPHLYEAFLREAVPVEKEKIAWQICRYWMNGVPKHSKSAAPALRQAWMFLLGTKHDFAHAVPKLKSVKFPSPWKDNEFVIAERNRAATRKMAGK